MPNTIYRIYGAIDHKNFHHVSKYHIILEMEIVILKWKIHDRDRYLERVKFRDHDRDRDRDRKQKHQSRS